MGNEVSTVGGAVATVATSVAAGVTFGQVDALNKAVVDCAKFTARHAEETTVRHVGEAAACAVATAGVGAAALVTFGEVEVVNETLEQYAKSTAESAAKAGKGLVQLADEVSDGLPIVAHVKGGILYAVGEEERADRAMKSGTRTLGTMAGGALGFVGGGPVGAVAGGVAAGAAMDGIITGVDSAVHKEFRPCGQVAAWHAVAKGESSDDIIGGVIGGAIIPVLDGAVGLGAGKPYGKWSLSKKLLTYRKFDSAGESEPSLDDASKTVHRAKYAEQLEAVEATHESSCEGLPNVPIPSEGIAEKTLTLYRGDVKLLPQGKVDEVLENGGLHNDIAVYKHADQGQGDCKFVSTSPKFGVVRHFAGSLDKGNPESDFAFMKLNPKRGIDLQITAENLELINPFPAAGQSELSLLEGIGPQSIMGFLVGKKGGFTWHRNANYVPPPRPAFVDVAYLSLVPLW